MSSTTRPWSGQAGLHEVSVWCNLGTTPADVWGAVLSGRAPTLPTRTHRLFPGGLGLAEITAELSELPAPLSCFSSRTNRLARAATAPLREGLEAMCARYGRTRVGVVIGTSTSGIAEGTHAVQDWLCGGKVTDGFAYKAQEPASPATFLATWLDLQGPVMSVSTACTSGARALITARRFLALDLCDAVLVGGVDTLCELTIQGFASIGALSPGRCRPFCEGRDGIVLGEAAALFLMSREPAPVVLLGAGSSSDAHHMSSPDPEGRGAVLAMTRALADGGCDAEDVGYVNLHGTGTPLNDAMEARAMAQVFPRGVACSTTKLLTGHTLGAAGALEAALCMQSLTSPTRALPLQVWAGSRDQNLPALAFVTPGERLSTGKSVVMSNNFAFGGNNTSLLLQARA